MKRDELTAEIKKHLVYNEDEDLFYPINNYSPIKTPVKTPVKTPAKKAKKAKKARQEDTEEQTYRIKTTQEEDDSENMKLFKPFRKSVKIDGKYITLRNFLKHVEAENKYINENTPYFINNIPYPTVKDKDPANLNELMILISNGLLNLKLYWHNLFDNGRKNHNDPVGVPIGYSEQYIKNLEYFDFFKSINNKITHHIKNKRGFLIALSLYNRLIAGITANVFYKMGYFTLIGDHPLKLILSFYNFFKNELKKQKHEIPIKLKKIFTDIDKAYKNDNITTDIIKHICEIIAGYATSFIYSVMKNSKKYLII